MNSFSLGGSAKKKLFQDAANSKPGSNRVTTLNRNSSNQFAVIGSSNLLNSQSPSAMSWQQMIVEEEEAGASTNIFTVRNPSSAEKQSERESLLSCTSGALETPELLQLRQHDSSWRVNQD